MHNIKKNIYYSLTTHIKSQETSLKQNYTSYSIPSFMHFYSSNNLYSNQYVVLPIYRNLNQIIEEIMYLDQHICAHTLRDHYNFESMSIYRN